MSKINTSTSRSGFHPLIHTLGRLFCHWCHSFSSLLLAIFSTSTVMFTSVYRYYVMSPFQKRTSDSTIHSNYCSISLLFAETHTHMWSIFIILLRLFPLFFTSLQISFVSITSVKILVKVTNCLLAAKSNGMFLVLDKLLRFRYT